MGASPLPRIVLQESGDWSMFAPKFEPQRKQFETFNCVSFNTIDCVQRLIQRLTGNEENYSDRFLGLAAGTTYGGNDPKTVAEALRKNGLIPEDLLPFSDNLKTLEEYYSFKDSDENECRGWGRKWLKKWDFGYEFVFNSDVPDKPERMMEALKYSPLGVSVAAWNYDSEKDLFVKDKTERSNHWTVCVIGYKENEYWLIDDSYLEGESNLKKLSWNYSFDYAMRYFLKKKETDQERQRSFTFFGMLKGFFAKWLDDIFK